MNQKVSIKRHLKKLEKTRLTGSLTASPVGYYVQTEESQNVMQKHYITFLLSYKVKYRVTLYSRSSTSKCICLRSGNTHVPKNTLRHRCSQQHYS